jgi:hypothetical protein
LKNSAILHLCCSSSSNMDPLSATGKVAL